MQGRESLKSSRNVLFAVSAAFVFNWAMAARADTPVSWASSSASGNWSDPTQWTPAVSPDGAYAVTLPNGGETVTLDISPNIDSLILGSGATLRANAATSLTTGSLNNSGQVIFTSGGTFTVSGATANSNAFYVGNGTTLSVSGDVTNSGTFQTGYNSGGDTVNVSGTFNNTGTLNLALSGDVVNVNALNNQARVNVPAGTTLNISGGGLGVTDVAAGSSYYIGGNFNVVNGAVTASALAHLASVEGILYIESGKTYGVGPLTNSNGFYVGDGTTLSVSGSVTNSGTFQTGIDSGGDTVSVSGTFNNTGTLNLALSGDTVNVNAISNQGTVTVGSGNRLGVGSGSFSATNGYQQIATGTLNEIIGGSGTYGIADVSGPVVLGGTLDVTLINGFTPSLGESFTFFHGTTGELSGEFASVDGQPFGGGQWQVAYDNSAGTVTLTAIATVPEPASLAMLCLGGLGLLRRTHRRTI